MLEKSLSLHIVNPLKGETVALVAGGAGFLGSHLCEQLLKTCRVICIDNLSFGKRGNIANCLKNEKFTLIEYDITRPLNDLIRKKTDYIFHVAGIDEVDRAEKASLENLLLNTYGTRNLLEKAVIDKAKFLLVSTLEHRKNIDESIDTAQARLFSENITSEYIKKFGVDARIIRVGHLFGPRMTLDTQNPMSVVIKDLLETGSITIANDELGRIYPMFIKDCIALILQTIFTKGTYGKIFNLVSPQSVSLLELSKIIKEVDKNFTISFHHSGKKIKLSSQENRGQGYSLSASTHQELVRQLKETFYSFQNNNKTQLDQQMGEPSKKTKEKKVFSVRFAAILFFLSVFVFSTILPLLLLFASSYIGAMKLNATYDAMRRGKLDEAAKSASISRYLFAASQNFLWLLSPHFKLLQKETAQESIALLLKSGEDTSLSSVYLTNAAKSLGEFFKKSVKAKNGETKSDLSQTISDLNVAAGSVSLLEKELEEIESSHLLANFLGEFIKQKKELLSDHRQTITLIQTLVNVMPDLLGFDEKRTYLVLFQNNMELRPGGGFIGSYGLVTFEKGKLISFDIFDVYQADGQLLGHVEPPSALRKILGQPNWFLRDSNWDPDFQKVAAQAAWFLDKEVGTKAHGVIAIDVSLAQFLLEALGPVSLPDYKETITKDNLFEKVETHSEIDFFPGSTQKKDFLGSLDRRIIDRLLSDENLDWLSILSALKRGVLEKHLLFSFNNESVQEVFTLNNWAGNILTLPNTEGTLNDFRMIVEANLGVNKANFFVKRKISDEVIIGKEGEISGTLSITYTNDSPTTWPGGTYINYLRLLFPQFTKLTSIAIDGKEARLQSPPPAMQALRAGEAIAAGGQASLSGRLKEGGFEVEEATQSGLRPGQEGRNIFGFLLKVEPHSTKSVSINYQLSDKISVLPGSNTYEYIFQKQPGAREDPLGITINYPQFFRIKNTNAQVFREKQSVTLSTDLAQDRLFKVEFIR